MTSLDTLRQTPQITPAKFLAAQPGCWIQYYDDTASKDPAMALSARSFDATVARRKQQERCAVCFSLQAFGEARTKENLLCFRNLGVDVDLVLAAERSHLTPEEIDQRKDEYLSRYLLPFPLKPHWLIETRHGFHTVFRIMPCLDEASIRDASALNRLLVALLRGDPNAALLTQVLRVPGTYQFKIPVYPFLCRLLLNNASAIRPYDRTTVRNVLDAREVIEVIGRDAEVRNTPPVAGPGKRPAQWPDRLRGVPEGQRNAAAASIVGAILGRLPKYLWETAGWGGLKEWNQRNVVPLPEGELRSVYDSIARRERAKRQREVRATDGVAPTSSLVQLGNRIEGNKTGRSINMESTKTAPGATVSGTDLPTSSHE